MSGPCKGFLVLVLLIGLILMSPAQDAVTIVQLPDSRTTQLTFTTIDVPGAGVTSVRGINIAGDIVGLYASTNHGPFHAFSVLSGTFHFFDYPGAESTAATAINDAGQIAGYAAVFGGLRERGFRYDGKNFTSIQIRNRSVTIALGMNNAGDIVGGDGSLGATRGFEIVAQRLRAIVPPGSYVYAYATAINNRGGVVGWISEGSGDQGFLYRNGTFKTVGFPGATLTEAWGINDDGTIVGWYVTGSSTNGYAFIHGHYISFGYPGAIGTFPRGVNSLGQVVGEYTFDYQSYHGFVTSALP